LVFENILLSLRKINKLNHMSCLIITREIRELAKMFPNETEDSIKNLVSLWQEKNNKSIEEYPSGGDLNKFIVKIRTPKVTPETINRITSNEFLGFTTPVLSFLEEQQKVDLDFDPRTRRDRVTLISRFFSNEINESIKELSDSINMRLNSATGDEKIQLEKELNSLDRFSVIKKYTPGGIFNRVKNIFE
jgi:hypothetical protein